MGGRRGGGGSLLHRPRVSGTKAEGPSAPAGPCPSELWSYRLQPRAQAPDRESPRLGAHAAASTEEHSGVHRSRSCPSPFPLFASPPRSFQLLGPPPHVLSLPSLSPSNSLPPTSCYSSSLFLVPPTLCPTSRTPISHSPRPLPRPSTLPPPPPAWGSGAGRTWRLRSGGTPYLSTGRTAFVGTAASSLLSARGAAALGSGRALGGRGPGRAWGGRWR